jgi:peptidyl-prolyl cis-trans isomerase C
MGLYNYVSRILFLSLCLSLVISVCAIAQDVTGQDKPKPENESTVLATIGTKKITIKDLNDRISKLPPQYQEHAESREGRSVLLVEMIRIEVFSAEANKTGISKTPEYKRKLQYMSRTLLASEYIRKKTATSAVGSVTEKEIADYYQANPAEFAVPEKIKGITLFIVVRPDSSRETVERKKDDIEQLVKQAREGQDFLAIVKRYSEEGVKEESDFFARGRLVPELEKVAFSLKIGEISPVVKVTDGFIAFKLTGRQPAGKLSFGEVKNAIYQKLLSDKKQKAFDETQNRLFGKYKVKIMEQNKETSAANAKTAPEGK